MFVQSTSRVLLQTARVKVWGARGIREATILFDTGSDRSYVMSDFVNKAGPLWVDSQPIAYAAFGSGNSSNMHVRNIYDVTLQDETGADHTLFATEVPAICAPLVCPEVSQQVLQSFGELSWASDCDYSELAEIQVDILIGLDSYWKFVKPQIVSSSLMTGLMAQATIFGWVLFGAVSNSQPTSGSEIAHQMLCLTATVSDQSVHAFWNLESVGICDDKGCDDADYVLTQFQQDILKVHGRYEVALPWKSGARQRLLNNEKLARRRLENLGRRLDRDPPLKVRYNAAIKDMAETGIVEEVPVDEVACSGPVFYMPHHPVVKESAVSTKVRPVFDASAKGFNGVSLNDCMEVGPCLLSNLTEILIRFRRWKFVVTADIQKAFLQIGVCKQDCDVHRFLWDIDGQVKVMRFLRVPFGNCSSPFLLNATIQHHLSLLPSSRTVTELQQNLYVDDFLSGCDSEDEICDMIREASDIMSQASMTLAKWGSNSSEVTEVLQRDFADKALDEEFIKVLGMYWLASPDCFTFRCTVLPESLYLTKRVVLSLFSRLFDPLGFAAPFIMQAKCLFQELWKLGLQWDQEIPPESQIQFLRWIDGLKALGQWRIPRSFTGSRWCDIRSMQLHRFGDASPKGYGACVYLQAEMVDGTCCSSLIIAKSRVAPLKQVTLPRLELLGALLCARLLVFARDALGLSGEVQCRCWTDSMVTLSWIRSDPLRWKTFVCNRVTDIQKLVPAERWSFCPGNMNPADLLTRGICVEELVHSRLWLAGPDMLQDVDMVPFSEGPCDPEPSVTCESSIVIGGSSDVTCESSNVTGGSPSVTCESSDVTCESSIVIGGSPSVTCESSDVTCESFNVTLLTSQHVNEKLLDVDRWGSLSKAIRVVAWMLRFMANSRSPERLHGALTFDELTKAKFKLIQCVQRYEFAEEIRALEEGRPVSKSSALAKLTPFIDTDGLVRVQGRLQFSALSRAEKHPIILPRCHLSVLLVRFQHHLLKHAGVSLIMASLRNEFWIISVRRIAKQVKRSCVSCQRHDSQPCSQPMPPLPADRVSQAFPFAVSGLDHAGPLFCCDNLRKKYWVLLFTCAVVRSVHLELVESLSTPETVLALRRFAARRGLPHTIYSDNAKGLVASPAELDRHFGHLAPKWLFITPRSPWRGGWWERLIQSLKSALKKTVGCKCLTRSELETTIHEIEACVNSRPLTFLSGDIDVEKPLTPSHFLLGHGQGYYRPHLDVAPVTSSQDLGHRFELRKTVLDQFWVVWTTDYIRNLPPWKGTTGRCEVKIGSVVLVQDVNQPRLKWPLGIVTQVFPGRDGVVRTVEVRMAKGGNLVRSVPRIHDLEIVNDNLSDRDNIEPNLGPSDQSNRSDVNVNPSEQSNQSDDTNVGPSGQSNVSDNGLCAEKPYVTRHGRVVKRVKKFSM